MHGRAQAGQGGGNGETVPRYSRYLRTVLTEGPSQAGHGQVAPVHIAVRGVAESAMLGGGHTSMTALEIHAERLRTMKSKHLCTLHLCPWASPR